MAQGNDALGEALYTLAAGIIRRRSRTLSLTALSTLATLEHGGPKRLTDLAVAEEITQPSMTSLVTQLEQLGLAERRRAGAKALTESIDKLDEQDAAELSAALPALRRLVDVVAES